jgi:hypothetical protein
MQVARDGGPAPAATTGGAVPTRGRHRTPDTGEVPASDVEGSARAAVGQSAAPDRVPSPRSAARSLPSPGPVAALSGPDDDAVTDLLAGPTRRGRAAVPDGPGTGRVPGLLGLVLGVLAMLGAVVAAAAPDVVVPVIGRLGVSPLALAALLALGLLATACAGLGIGPRRRGRGVAVTGMVVGLAAVAAAVVPLVALASL